VNLTPDGPHLLDTSAVIHMRRHGVVASPEAFVAFPTLGELATGVFRAAEIGQEAAGLRAVLASVANLFPSDQTPTLYGPFMGGSPTYGTQPLRWSMISRCWPTMPTSRAWRACGSSRFGSASVTRPRVSRSDWDLIGNASNN
jgi:hypothetical protein